MPNALKEITLKHVIGCVVMLCFLFNNIILIFRSIPDANKEAVYHMQGILDAAVIAIVGYYFGSSQGSKAKTQLLEEARKDQEQ